MWSPRKIILGQLQRITRRRDHGPRPTTTRGRRPQTTPTGHEHPLYGQPMEEVSDPAHDEIRRPQHFDPATHDLCRSDQRHLPTRRPGADAVVGPRRHQNVYFSSERSRQEGLRHEPPDGRVHNGSSRCLTFRDLPAPVQDGLPTRPRDGCLCRGSCQAGDGREAPGDP